MDKGKKVKVRRWRPEDIPAIVACHAAAYSEYSPDMLYGERHYQMQLAAFPEGQFLAEVDGQVVGYATSLIVQLDDEAEWYTYQEITGAGTSSTHNPSGDTLYGSDIAVHPDYRGQGVAGRLYEQRHKLMKRYNLRRMVAYGRLPGYQQVAGKMTAEEYVERVKQGELKDPALNAHLKAGYQAKRVLLDFVADAPSLNYSTLLEMPNPNYRPERRRIAAAPLRRPVRKIRVCAAQYLMRPIRTWQEFEKNVEFFVTTADAYHCHFLLLPEFFTAQLFTLMPADWDTRTAVKELAGYTERYLDMFTRLTTKYRLHIIGGSQPVLREDKLYNVAHLFTPSGNVYTQDKLHITPGERSVWDVRPGEELKIFETPLARIAISVCYDIEFPELARLLTFAGVEVIFVPFSTDERKAYYRVRATAQARAIENFIYVVIAGNVGNLPTRSYLLNYGQAAIFTPSDFPFPFHATAGEADPNVETVVINDLDLTNLVQHRETGDVRPLHDRRPDLYDLQAKQKVKIVRTE